MPKLVGVRTPLLVQVVFDGYGPRTCEIVDTVQTALNKLIASGEVQWSSVRVELMPRFVPGERDCASGGHDFYVVTAREGGGSTLAGDRICRRCGKKVSGV